MLRTEAIDQAGIARLIPHQGAMCLLDRVEAWDEDWITCRASSHLLPTNPLRRKDKLGLLAGIEYAMQATAVHGALRAGRPQKPAYLAALREVVLGSHDRLDDPAVGHLMIRAWLERDDPAGFIYRFEVAGEAGHKLVAGRAVIALFKKESLLF